MLHAISSRPLFSGGTQNPTESKSSLAHSAPLVLSLKGRTVHFANTIVLFTSNLGSELQLQAMESGTAAGAAAAKQKVGQIVSLRCVVTCPWRDAQVPG